MKMPFRYFSHLRPWLGTLIVIVVAALAHEWLKHYMLDRQIVAQLLSPGAHTQPANAAAALAFLLLRIFVILALPGFLLSRAGLMIWDRMGAGNR